MKHKQTLISHWRPAQFEGGNPEYTLCQADMSKYGLGYVVVGPVVVEYETPDDFNPVAAEIAVLQERANELRRGYESSVAQINRRVSELTAIEYAEVVL